MKVKVKVYSVAHVWPSGTNNFDILDVTRVIFKFDIEGAEEDRAEHIILRVKAEIVKFFSFLTVREWICHQAHNFVI